MRSRVKKKYERRPIEGRKKIGGNKNKLHAS